MTPQDVFNSYKNTFDQHVRAGNVPFGIYLHPLWIGPAVSTAVPDGTEKFKAISSFIDYAQNQGAWLVTPSQLIEYMKNPVPERELANQSYMQCTRNPAPPTNICNGLNPSLAETCNLINGTIRVFIFFPKKS